MVVLVLEEGKINENYLKKEERKDRTIQLPISVCFPPWSQMSL